jgi:hypothetical protein
VFDPDGAGAIQWKYHCRPRTTASWTGFPGSAETCGRMANNIGKSLTCRISSNGSRPMEPLASVASVGVGRSVWEPPERARTGLEKFVITEFRRIHFGYQMTQSSAPTPQPNGEGCSN